MARTVYNKLVRDRIPQFIRSRGATAVAHSLPVTDRLPALLQKVREEASELASAKPEKLSEELADLLELLQAISLQANIPWETVIEQQDAKRKERGGFREGVFLEYTEE